MGFCPEREMGAYFLQIGSDGFGGGIQDVVGRADAERGDIGCVEPVKYAAPD